MTTSETQRSLLIHAADSSPGTREFNEDLVFAHPDKGWYAVLDGLGGEGKGDWASKLIAQCLDEQDDPLSALQAANDRIYQAVQADPELKGAGATAAVVQVRDSKAEIFHAGEVRVYLVRAGELRQLTEDQTLAMQLVKLNQLTPEQAATHPSRKAPLQYVGKGASLKLSQHELSLEPGDVFLLCSDGLYDSLPASALCSLGEADAPDALSDAVRTLLQQAQDNGSQDNLSLVVIRMPSAPAGQGVPASDGLVRSLLVAPDPLKALSAHLHETLAPALSGKAFVVANRDGRQRVLAAFGAEAHEFESFAQRPGVSVHPLGSSASGTAPVVLYLEKTPSPSELSPLFQRLGGLDLLFEVASLRENVSKQAERFEMLNDLGRSVASSLNVDEVLRLLLQSTLELTKADMAYVIVPDGDALKCRAGLNQHGESLTGLEISYTLANRVLHSREPLCILDTGADQSSQTASVMALNLQSVMCVPMVVNDHLVGLLYVSSNFVTHSFTEAELDMLIAIAGQTALSVQNAFYVAELDQKNKLEAELGIAHTIQMGMLPTTLPELPGYSLAGRCVPALEVGGDLYEVFQQESGHLGMVIGDVSGKNVSAALYMAVTHMAVRSILQDAPTPLDGLKKLNATVTPDFKDGSYVTALFVSLDAETGVGRYVCAGHTPNYLLRRDGRIEEVWQRGFFVGIEPRLFDAKIKEAEFKLEPGDSLVMFTDGITEARAPHGEEFGEERLCETLRQAPDRSAPELLETLYAALKEFVRDALPFDDKTVLIITRE